MAKVNLTISVESDNEDELLRALKDMLARIGKAVESSPAWTWEQRKKGKKGSV